MQDQVRNLTRQAVAILSLVSGQVTQYMEPGYIEERPKEGTPDDA